MENFYSAVIPAKAGIQWLQGLGDPCLRRDDGKEAFFDTLLRGDDTEVQVLHLSIHLYAGMTAYVVLSARRVMNFGLMT